MRIPTRFSFNKLQVQIWNAVKQVTKKLCTVTSNNYFNRE